MEVQTCAFETCAINNSNHYYGKINMGSATMCFLIIYSTALTIVLSVKQLIQVIKEEEEEVIENEEELQSKYIKQIQVLFEKKIKNSYLGSYENASTAFWDRLKKENLNKEAQTTHGLQGYAYEDLMSLTYNVKPFTDILASLCKKDRKTIAKELDEEIIFNIKKAGLFVFRSDYDEIEFYKDTYKLFKIVKMVDFSNMLEKAQASQNKFGQCIEEYRDKMKWNASQYEEDEDD